MKKQDNHKKPRKLMDQVSAVMHLNRNRERMELVKTIHERDLKIRYNV